MLYFLLHGDPAQCICHRADQNDGRENGAEILDHKVEDDLAAERFAAQSDLFLDLFYTDDAGDQRQMVMAAMGIMTELVRKSKKSKNCIPNTVTPASGP